MKADVMRAIMSERAYQDKKWGASESSEGARTLDEFARYISVYADQLKALVGGHKLHAVRKVAALAVACMEQHGAPLRQTPSWETPVPTDFDESAMRVETLTLRVRTAVTELNNALKDLADTGRPASVGTERFSYGAQALVRVEV